MCVLARVLVFVCVSICTHVRLRAYARVLMCMCMRVCVVVHVSVFVRGCVCVWKEQVTISARVLFPLNDMTRLFSFQMMCGLMLGVRSSPYMIYHPTNDSPKHVHCW